jgi:hypothetical protein
MLYNRVSLLRDVLWQVHFAGPSMHYYSSRGSYLDKVSMEKERGRRTSNRKIAVLDKTPWPIKQSFLKSHPILLASYS